MKKIDRRLSLRSETIATLTTKQLEPVAGGIINSDQCSTRCSKMPGSCLTCGPSQCM